MSVSFAKRKRKKKAFTGTLVLFHCHNSLSSHENSTDIHI